jgi:putative ABC transport system substrate-binding protein
VASGLVASLARAGGNITESTVFLPEQSAKRLKLLNEACHARRMAALSNPDNPAMRPALEAMEQTAKSLKVEFQAVEVRGPEDFPGAFSTDGETPARGGRGA